MRIVIATAQVPFVRGGAELHAEGLRDALQLSGHQAEIAAIPFKWYPPERILDNILACRNLDLTESCGTPIDLLIGLKFPAYFIEHPRKVIWVLHQYRDAYDLWGHEYGALHRYASGRMIRDAIEQADRMLIPRAKKVFANSLKVAERLKSYCGIDSEPLYHPPPNASQFHCGDYQPYFFFPSRLNRVKRQELVLQALARTRHPVEVRFCGAGDDLDYAGSLPPLARELKLGTRVQWLGDITEKDKADQYANALAVLFPPWDEDYGYVTLEAMLSAKAVITCSDSGGPLEFVRSSETGSGETGLVADPTPESLASAMDALWEDRAAEGKSAEGKSKAQRMGEAGRKLCETLGVSWKHAVEKLLSCV